MYLFKYKGCFKSNVSYYVDHSARGQQKEHRMQVYQDLLNQNEAEGDNFLDSIVPSNEMRCHPYKLESKQQPTEWQHVNLPLKKKLKRQLSAGEVRCLVGQGRGDPSGFLGTQTNHQL